MADTSEKEQTLENGKKDGGIEGPNRAKEAKPVNGKGPATRLDDEDNLDDLLSSSEDEVERDQSKKRKGKGRREEPQKKPRADDNSSDSELGEVSEDELAALDMSLIVPRTRRRAAAAALAEPMYESTLGKGDGDYGDNDDDDSDDESEKELEF